jgi:hypothetical protein
MTVYVAHAPADREAAEALEKFLERRGQFVEPDDGSVAMRPVQQSDVVVLILSKDFVFGPTRLRLEQRALDAWADQRLIVVKLDKSIAPVGLRDLPTIESSFEAQREFKWQEVANQVRETLARRSDVMFSRGARRDRSPEKLEADRKASERENRRADASCFVALAMLLIAIPGVVAMAASVSIWLANRIGPRPGTLEDLRRGIDQFGMRYGVPSGVTEWLFVAAMIVTLLVVFYFAVQFFMPGIGVPKRKSAPSQSHAEDEKDEDELEAEPEPPQTNTVFVSYARANAKEVLAVIDAAKAQGRSFWIDQKGIGAGQSWAGEIVRAIRTASGVVVMCSKAAFESDHIKREIYLADRYRKKLTPVFIEQAEPPEDFEYFFAGVQQLKLFETPEAERPEALMRVLGAAT